MSALTIPNGAYVNAKSSGYPFKGVKVFKEYRLGRRYIDVPRNFNVTRHIGEVDILSVGNYRNQPPMDTAFPPRTMTQVEAVMSLKSGAKDRILCLACGIGKTYCAIKAAAESGKLPMLIVVHTNLLHKQWVKEVKAFLGVQPSDIGLIRQGKESWRGKKVVVAYLPTLAKRKYPREFYGNFRLVVFDETHKLGAAGFSKVGHMFLGERWGLSATPCREDGNDRIFRLHLGNVCYESLEQPLEPRTTFVRTGVLVPEYRLVTRAGRLHLPFVYSWLSDGEECPERDAIILDILRRCVAAGRRTLVIGERINELTRLHEKDDFSKSKALVTSKLKDRDAAMEVQTIYGIQQITKEGMDAPGLDTLLMLSTFKSKGRLQQSVGRILRPHEGKKDPYVIVLEDSAASLTAMGRHLRKHLEAFGFNRYDTRTYSHDLTLDL